MANYKKQPDEERLRKKREAEQLFCFSTVDDILIIEFDKIKGLLKTSEIGRRGEY